MLNYWNLQITYVVIRTYTVYYNVRVQVINYNRYNNYIVYEY